MRVYPLPSRKISKRLVELGFEIIRQKGSHVFFSHMDGRTTVVPNHPGEDISRGLIRKITRDIEITVEEFYSTI